jgi:hypothetical protein
MPIKINISQYKPILFTLFHISLTSLSPFHARLSWGETVLLEQLHTLLSSKLNFYTIPTSERQLCVIQNKLFSLQSIHRATVNLVETFDEIKISKTWKKFTISVLHITGIKHNNSMMLRHNSSPRQTWQVEKVWVKFWFNQLFFQFLHSTFICSQFYNSYN